MSLPLIAAGLGLASAVGNYFSAKDTNNANISMANQATETNIAEAAKNRQFQEQQSNTAYQRARKDMEAAGINPILAYSQGGASASSGSTASAETAKLNTPTLDDISPVLNSALSQKNALTELAQKQEMNDSAIATQKTQAVSNLASAKTQAAMAEKVNQDRQNSIAELALKTGDQQLKKTALDQTLVNQKLDAASKRADLPARQSQAQWEKAQTDYKTKHADVIVPVNTATDTVGRVIDNVTSGLNIFKFFRPSEKTTTDRIDSRTGEIKSTTTSRRYR